MLARESNNKYWTMFGNMNLKLLKYDKGRDPVFELLVESYVIMNFFYICSTTCTQRNRPLITHDKNKHRINLNGRILTYLFIFVLHSTIPPNICKQ